MTEQSLPEWKQDVESRAAGHKHAVSRGAARPRGVAGGAWRCEGRWQAEDQLDIWQCIDEATRDELSRAEAAAQSSESEVSSDGSGV